MKIFAQLLALIAMSASAAAHPMIDDTPTRVQTSLNPGFDLIGTLRPKSVHELSASRWSLDCAGTDREHADYHSFKEYLEALGIKRLRTQAGWARCEKERGVYDFAWLDSIVFDAKKRGLEVWLETSYGNPLYPGGGGRGLGAGLPYSKEALAAWDRWVEAMARRYRGAVRDWCIWNEPDLTGKNGIDAVVALVLRSARIIKHEIPDARIAACAITKPDPEFAENFCRRLRDSGAAGLFTWFGYHHYTENPDDGYDAVEKMRSVVRKYTPNLRLWQNESGIESEWCPSGALSRRHWSELTQAKWILRRYLADLGIGDETAVFHAVDLDYRAANVQYGLCRYGLLKTEGQLRDFKIDKVKMAYYAVQNAVSVFNDEVECFNAYATLSGIARPALYGFRTYTDKVPIIVFWDASAVPSQCNSAKEVALTLSPAAFQEPVWVDVLTGNAYRIPADRIAESQGKSVYKLPVYDSPVFVTERSVLDLQLSEYAKEVVERHAVEAAVPLTGAVFSRADASVAGTRVKAHNGRFDLAVFAKEELERLAAKPAPRPIPQVTGTLAFRIRSLKETTVPFFIRCDWYWRFYVNGVAMPASEGSASRWTRGELKLNAGDNEVLLNTRPGNSGGWFVELRIGEKAFSPADLSY